MRLWVPEVVRQAEKVLCTRHCPEAAYWRVEGGLRSEVFDVLTSAPARCYGTVEACSDTTIAPGPGVTFHTVRGLGIWLGWCFWSRDLKIFLYEDLMSWREDKDELAR